MEATEERSSELENRTKKKMDRKKMNRAVDTDKAVLKGKFIAKGNLYYNVYTRKEKKS